jgi:hypothetical protein
VQFEPYVIIIAFDPNGDTNLVKLTQDQVLAARPLSVF